MKQRMGHVDSVMERALREGVFPGATLVVGTAGECEAHSYGVTTQLPGGAAVKETTIYDLASLSKLFTATAVLMLLERGELRLDDGVGRFLPPFQRRSDKGELRLRHLLTHTSGLPAHRPLYQKVASKAEMCEAIADTELAYETSKQVLYSCLGFITLAHIIEAVAGEPLDVFLQTNLFLPLGMTATSYGAAMQPQECVAPTEECGWRGRVLWGEVHDENAYAQGGVSGNAGLFSSGPDLARFAQMLLRGGQSERGAPILSPATIRTATSSYTAGLGENRGLGWQLRSDEYPWCGDLASAGSFGHTGFTGTSLWISPAQDLFIVLLSNRVHPTRENNQHLRYRPLIHNTVMANWQR